MEKTTKTNIVKALRRLWLMSRERTAALKRDEYTCQTCGVKKSQARGHEVRVEVNHKHGICNWDKIVEAIREELLCDPEKLETLCVPCHKEVTKKQKEA